MKVMRSLLGALIGVSALAGVANAQEVAISGNVALTSDYQFRGISQTLENPAVQGGFDVGVNSFYVGTWASNIDFGTEGTMELDIYAGFKPQLTDTLALDLGVVGYLYPGLDDSASEADYYELKAGAIFTPSDAFGMTGTLFWSPEFTFDGGDSLYAEVGASYAATDYFSLSGAVGNQSVDTATYFIDGSGSSDSYTTWNLGGTLSAYGFGVDVRYVDTTLEDNDLAEERVIFTIKRAL